MSLTSDQVESVFAVKTNYNQNTSKSIVLNQLVSALLGYEGRISMVRHGQTSFSEKGVFAGGVSMEMAKAWADDPHNFNLSKENIPLSPLGIQLTTQFYFSEMGGIFRRFADSSLVFVSPLTRAQDTANILLDSRPYVIVPELNERYLGEDFAMKSDERSQNKLDDPNYAPKGGESGTVYAERVLSTLTALILEAKKVQRDLVIIGHSHWIKIALAGLVALTGKMVRKGAWNERVEPCMPLMISGSVRDGRREISEFSTGFMVPKATPEPRKVLSNRRFPANEDESDDPAQQSRNVESSLSVSRRSALRPLVR